MILLWITLGILTFGLIVSATSYGHFVRICRKNETMPASANLNGAEFTDRSIRILELNSHYGISPKEHDDKYLLDKDIIVLSQKTAEGMSVTAISVAAHELGHAMQKNNKSVLMFVHSSLGYLSAVAQFLLVPTLLAGIVMLFIPSVTHIGIILLYFVIGFLVTEFLFRLLSIPLEYDASKRAYQFLKKYEVLNSRELRTSKKIMHAAGMTYVGGLFIRLLKVLRAIGRSFNRT